MDWKAIGQALHLWPLERWLKAIGNSLQAFSLAFVGVIVIAAIVLFNPSGMPADQQRHFLDFSFGLIVLVLLIVAVLSGMSGDRLYSPYQRSLRRGNNYGTVDRPRSKSEEEHRREGQDVPLLGEGQGPLP